MLAFHLYLLASSIVLAAATPIASLYSDPLPISKRDPDNANAFASVLGPVVTDNFPDPSVIYVDGTSYAFATTNGEVGSALINVQVATSKDNSTWTLVAGHDALPNPGAWQTGGAQVWGPDVNVLDDGTFVMYYSDEIKSSPGHHCVGAATSKNVLGPYVPQDNPLACPDPNTAGGAIDPDGFLDSDGKRYIAYKVDGNSIGHGGACGNTVAPIVPTPIMLQEVDKDGITLIGGAVQLLDRDDADGPLIEAPSLHRSDEGIYFLFFSSNCYTTTLYDTSYATSNNIRGPYTKSGQPLLVSGDGPGLVAPGGTDIIKDGGLILFHAHLGGAEDSKRKRDMRNASERRKRQDEGPLVRGLYAAQATFSGTTVSLSGPSP